MFNKVVGLRTLTARPFAAHLGPRIAGEALSSFQFSRCLSLKISFLIAHRDRRDDPALSGEWPRKKRSPRHKQMGPFPTFACMRARGVEETDGGMWGLTR